MSNSNVLGSGTPEAAPGLGDAAPSTATATGQTLVLLVTPDQAEQLAYARAFADLSISVEGPHEEVTP